MHRLKVESEAIDSVGYDASSRTLEIEYAGGAVYRYLDVPPRVHEQLLHADSIGGYVNRRIKPYHRWMPAGSQRRRARPGAASRRRTRGGA